MFIHAQGYHKILLKRIGGTLKGLIPTLQCTLKLEMYKQSIQGCDLDVECNNIEMNVTLRLKSDGQGLSDPEGCDYENFYISSNPNETSVPDQSSADSDSN